MTAPQPKMQEVVIGEMPTTAYVVEAEGGVIIQKGPDLFVPDSDLQKLEQIGKEMREEEAAAKADGKIACEHCAEWFAPRRSGGRRQRFCSEGCRRAFHAENPNASQREQRETAIQPTAGHVESYIGLPRDDHDFDWNDSESVVVPRRDGLAVYWNPRGEVVIRREAQHHPDEDEFCTIPPENLGPVIAALQEKQKEFEQEGGAA